MTNKQAAKEYCKLAIDLADVTNEISDIRDRARFLNEQCHDNGDPAYLLDEVLSKLAPALAMAVSYSRDYETDAQKLGPDSVTTDTV